MNDIFGEPISVYSQAQAIDDGHIRIPAMTAVNQVLKCAVCHRVRPAQEMKLIESLRVLGVWAYTCGCKK